MGEVGYLAVVLAFGCSVYATVASAVGAARRVGPLVESGRRGLLAAAVLTTLAVVFLEIAFFTHDFSLAYVWQTSSRTTPLFYLATALWGGQEGSLLFWSWLTCGFGAVVLLRRWRADVALLPWFTAAMGAAATFYLFLVVFVANPFERLAVLPPDGSGLNPLLQHPGMAFHPPTLYLGLTGLTVPFAFAVAALLSGELDAIWIQASRRWTLIGWMFLTIGLALGGRWAYDVLGWGGYWGWDPVENAALMPWIAATAFLHSVMVQERRKMFRIWNMVLVLGTYALTVIGTFLTRAGLVSSVHAFAQSDIGGYFLGYTALVCLGGIGLLAWRLDRLRDRGEIETVWSRETAFLANNVFLVGALFAVFWGTLWPLFREILTGERGNVGPPYFNAVVLPIFWVVILLMAIGPLMSWRRTEPAALGRALVRPAVASLAIIIGLAAVGVTHWIALVGFGTCAFALLVTLVEFARGVRARMNRGEGPVEALVRLVSRERRRYGGYVVHIGVIVLAIGVIGSNVYQVEVEEALAEGESVALGSYALTFDGISTEASADKDLFLAHVTVTQAGKPVGTVAPSRQLFRLREDQPQTIPGVLHRPLADVYLLLGPYDAATGVATFKAYLNPLIQFVWLGMLTLLFGTLVAAWPDPREERVLNAELERLILAGASP